MRLLIPPALVLLAGCGGDPASPTARVALDDGVHAAKGSTSKGSPVVAIDDALNRLIPSLDAETAGLLKGPLTAVKAALASGNAGATNGALAVATAALASPMAANDERIADLAAIALALDAATPK